ncbi:MAG: respiratory nitrate reductase subunit gamma [bacterium]|nr:respiratory nitrate reductase subunit gamma [bacterium]
MNLSAEAFRYLDQFLFIALPYLAFAIFFIGTIQRYRMQSFTYSSLSSQLLENKQHFWGMVPFHYGILVILAGHVVAFLIPRAVLAWNGKPLRLYILEVAALICGMLALVGLVMAVVRRIRHPRIRIVTTVPDWILLAMLLFQIATGVLVAIFVGWGSSWFAAAATPYLRSLLVFSPDINYLAEMPWVVRLHIINAFLLIAFFPFTRLVHVLVVPNMYLWRKPQVVRWNWNRHTVRRVD